MKCLNCEETINPRNNSNFCSKECAHIWGLLDLKQPVRARINFYEVSHD